MHFFLNSLSKLSLIIFLLISVYSSVLTIFNGSDNDSMLRVFSDDESWQVVRFQRMLESNSLDAGGFRGGFYHYGQAYNSIAFGIVNALDYFGFDKYSYSMSVLVFKILSISGYLLSIILMYLVLRSIGVSEFISSIFSLFLAINTDYWGWATTIHPDTIQMCFFLFSFLIITKIKNIEIAILLSSFVIGLSFGTKYSGIFLTVFIASIIILNTIKRVKHTNKNDNANYFFNISSWSIISFFFGWISLNPHILYRFNKLFRDLSYQSDSVTILGGGTILDDNWGEWFSMYYNEYGFIITITILFGLIYLLWEAMRYSKKCVRDNEFVNLISDNRKIALIALFFYCFVSILFLLIVIKFREFRYSFHILPFILILSSYGIHLLVQKYSNKSINIVVFLVIMSLIIPRGIFNLELLAQTHKIESENPYVAAGRWLKNNYDSSNSVLAGTYSYVDTDKFDKIVYTYEVNSEAINLLEPDIVFMNIDVPGRYVWKKFGTLFNDNDFVYSKQWKDQKMVNEYGELFKKMTSTNSNWLIVYESDSVVIFERKKGNEYEPEQ